jgi:hypothetical protein
MNSDTEYARARWAEKLDVSTSGFKRCADKRPEEIKNGSADFFSENQQSRLAHI